MSVLVVFLFLLTCTAYAASAATQKSTHQVKPEGGMASDFLNPNAHPQGTIALLLLLMTQWISQSYNASNGNLSLILH
jgi:hypothetical protein